MSDSLSQVVKKVCQACGNDRMRMMDIVRGVQEKLGCVSSEAMDLIAERVSTHRVEVESVVSFYTFLSEKPKGKAVIRLCNDVVDKMKGSDHVAAVLSEELGIGFGETTADGKITLEYAPCIGMCDQAPAALVNDVVVTNLSTDRAREIVAELKRNTDPSRLVQDLGDGNNAHELVQSMVRNNIRKRGPVIFADLEPGAGLTKALAMSPVEVIRDVKTARLRGRGGAGFPTGLKWEFTRAAAGDRRYVICNADEGEPGTFKDRAILTEEPDLLFEGMTIAGYAVGADHGILYLRGEYAYLRPFLESVLDRRRNEALLGKGIGGKADFDFDIRIQMGAGAYICGEESALISSCEGERGDPRNRPPFPAESGYMASPTTVNNVETLCCVARILDKGPGWFAQLGTKGSSGTKVLSISGDCKSPGVYEVPFGVKLSELLAMAGADETAAVQVGGPSGQMIGPDSFDRTICFDDLATGGAIVIFGPQRDLLEIVHAYMAFFAEETCGFCTPCRVGTTLLKNLLEKVIAGNGEPADIDHLKELGETVKMTSRCGFGQTAANPVLTSIENFRGVYDAIVSPSEDGMQKSFDLSAALRDSEEIAGRASAHS